MSDNPPTFEWKGRTDFAEHAEALGITTEDIMAVQPRADAATVLYTTNTHDLDRAIVYAALLRRDAEGVFVVAHQERKGRLPKWLRQP